jgi:RNA 3'-terminal phosphate cyclase (ATP)
MLVLDGSTGEGGGQILRTSLALSLITGTAFRIENIRAGRPRPGLMRQHLTAVTAAAEVGKAQLEGATLGSQSVVFRPGSVSGGEYSFAVGTAGSTTLVLQTILPALITAKNESKVSLEGGTHNSASPPFDFLKAAYLPLLKRMGPNVVAKLERAGFYPAGGGKINVSIAPTDLRPLVLHDRGEVVRTSARAIVANLPRSIADRELAQISKKERWQSCVCSVEQRSDSAGPGNAVVIEIESEQVTEVFTAFGEKHLQAEAVANSVAKEAEAYLDAGVPVGPHLADQFVLLLALAGEGSFLTSAPTLHTRTQLQVIERFLGPVIKSEERSDGSWMFSGRRGP